MRWLSGFALLLYLSLLCTPQAFAVHDARLSPLADTQFHAVTPAEYNFSANNERDRSDDADPALLLTAYIKPASFTGFALPDFSVNTQTAVLTLPQARAPPAQSSHH